MPDIEQIVQELTDIKQDIQNAKEEKAKCEGALAEQMKALKAMGVKSIADGKKQINLLQQKTAKLEAKIHTQYSKLQESYEW